MLLTATEKATVSNVDVCKITKDMIIQVDKELSGELFPKKIQLWEYMNVCPARLQVLIKYSVDEYLKLYQVCGSFAAKESELFLRWLEVVRSLTCEEKKTEKTRLLLKEVCGSGFYETQQSVIAIVLNSIHIVAFDKKWLVLWKQSPTIIMN